MTPGLDSTGPLIEQIERNARRGLGLLERANGSLHGWPGSRLPLGSRIGGAGRISIGRGFRPLGAVWIEAVTEYEGERYEPQITIGQDFRSSPGLHITAISSVTIGSNVLLGSHVFIGDHGHGGYRGDTPEDLDLPPHRRPLRATGPLEIGPDCWIGDNVVVVGAVTIGRGCVIGANSVVTRDIPEDSLAVGSPAKPVRTLSRSEQGSSSRP